MARTPLGYHLVKHLPKCGNRDIWYKGYILILTFLAYTTYHLSRKPIGVVKGVLHSNCSKYDGDDSNIPFFPVFESNTTDTCWCCWSPFDGGDANVLLGSLDYAYLFAYALGMFASGHIGERMDLRYFLSFGMIMSGFWTAMVGMAYFWKIHTFSYFIIMQIVGGLFQATGWPSVVAIVANWFGKGRRGLIMGVWNTHTSLGNILGSLVAGIFVDRAWGWSFIVPGFIIAGMGVIIFIFLIVYPSDIDCKPPNRVPSSDTNEYAEDRETFLNTPREEQTNPDDIKAITLWGALKIPGVVEFSLCLFFAKLVSYTFLYWLPAYIHSTSHVSDERAADLSTLFDAGGILGGILAGFLSDMADCSATVSFVSLIIAAPLVYLYNAYGYISFTISITLMMITGFFVNGPYALITTAVSADLGTHPSLKGNAKALATVSAIIDGTGTIGAAVGPLLTGVLNPNNDSNGWYRVFLMLSAAEIIGALLMVRQVVKEIRKWCRKSTVYQPLNTAPNDIDGPSMQLEESGNSALNAETQLGPDFSPTEDLK
ncbi:glucose-6-phosphate exchanger SLC37A2-like isoform X2 [Lytechinus variegatus]|uniref:glucose-6-phosphate exchanger SLC37A2-like isoform X2 n=1 Tax=Lytechinus variegatus TaxID=7654 RepID=UPI001BB177F2|nr:glucose-6-phosphate exchanger SLC37A2-like isoform X2 [Lytechinus variegatus]